MSSYWSKRRRVVSSVNLHVQALNNLDEDVGLANQEADEESLTESSPNLENPQQTYDNEQFTASVDDSVDLNNENISNMPMFEAHSPVWSENESSDSSESDCDSDDQEANLSTLLVSWVAKHNISHVAVNDLLVILRHYHPYLPKDVRTLMKTPKSYEVLNVAGGSYYHFGIENWVMSIVTGIENVTEVSLQVNIDGLPLFKSSGAQLWPILGRLVKPKISKPFVIGLYSGDQKPTSVAEYLNHFVRDLNDLFQNGVRVSDESEERVEFSLSCIICDAPAKAFVKQIKGHSGYHGCDKCRQRGVWHGKMTFPSTNSPLRTDALFDEMQDAEHHIGQSPFHNLPVGMVSQFPIDAMHLVYLGVVKRMILLWIKGPLENGCRIGMNAVKRISSSLADLKGFLPKEFSRKARTLDYVERWKATEFRQFLLYTGPVVLKKQLPPHLYKHFILLFVSMLCLSCSFFCETYRDYVQELLYRFVSQFGEIYGRDMVVFNVHGLVHLPTDVHKFGPLENFSAFVFESFLGKMKRLVRRPTLPLQQVIRRISESKGNLFADAKVSEKEGILKKAHANGPLLRRFNHMTVSQFKEIHFPDIFFSTSQGNNCFLVNDNVGIIRNIVLNDAAQKLIIYEQFTRVTNFFNLPLPSSDLRVKRVAQLSGILSVADFKDIICKCVLLPIDDDFVCIPLIHDLTD